MREAVRMRSGLKLDTPTAVASPCFWQSAKPCRRGVSKYSERGLTLTAAKPPRSRPRVKGHEQSMLAGN
jgi:hypothetical protein